MRNPSILVLDEATSAVDDETEADAIHVLQAGRVAETGTHDELVASGGLYTALWAVQTGELDQRVF